MPARRRALRGPPEHLQAPLAAFEEQVERVANARRALLSCLPVGRSERAPVSVGLDLLADELADVRAQMPAWKVDEVADAWRACRDALDAAAAAIPAAHALAASATELEPLLQAVTAVVEPLEAWADAERAWRRLRRSRGGAAGE